MYLFFSNAFPKLPPSEMTNDKIEIPVVSMIPGIGRAVREQLSSPTALSLAAKLYQSSKLEIVDLPMPVVFPPNAQTKGSSDQGPATTTQWMLDPDQQQVLFNAEALLMDAHVAAPLLLASKTNLPLELQHLLKKVRWVQGTYAGVDSYLQYPDAPLHPGFTVSRAGGIMPAALAQFVFGYVVAIERKFFEAKKYQDQRIFGRWELKYRSYRNLTIGVLGLGEVGQEIARMFKASEFRVVEFKRRIRNGDKKMLGSSVDTVTTDLSEVLKQSDYVVNALPSTNATRYLLTEQVLAICREKKSVFVNVGRGDVISKKTILVALNKGLFPKAVLDVFE